MNKEKLSTYKDIHGYILSSEYSEVQRLIDSGMAWTLEGSVGRHAMDCLEAGVCILGEDSHRDYWGNYVPSYKEVKQGTKGSLEYFLERQDNENNNNNI